MSQPKKESINRIAVFVGLSISRMWIWGPNKVVHRTAFNKQTRPMSGREKGIRLTKDTSCIIIANREPAKNDQEELTKEKWYGEVEG